METSILDYEVLLATCKIMGVWIDNGGEKYKYTTKHDYFFHTTPEEALDAWFQNQYTGIWVSRAKDHYYEGDYGSNRDSKFF